MSTVFTENARDYHARLGIGKHFSSWVKGRISKNEFSCGNDYIIMYGCGNNKKDNRGRKRKEYYMTKEAISKIERYETSIEYQKASRNDKEHGALCAIEHLLNISLERQYPVGKYRIDGYCAESNTAYEIDEEHHFNANGEIRKECKDRQAFIEKELGCKFIRIKV